MDALQKIVERKLHAYGNDQLPVQREAPFCKVHGSPSDFRKIAGEISPSLGLQPHAVFGPDQQAAEAIPFRLILPLGSIRQGVDRASLHGKHRFSPSIGTSSCGAHDGNRSSVLGFPSGNESLSCSSFFTAAAE